MLANPFGILVRLQNKIHDQHGNCAIITSRIIKRLIDIMNLTDIQITDTHLPKQN